MNRWTLALVLCLSGLLSGAAAGEDVESVWASIRDNSLDLSRAVAVSSVRIDLGAGNSLELHSGLLVPSKPIGDRTTELVFIGEAEFSMIPVDELEADQLELFAGTRDLNVTVQQAVLVIPRKETIRSLIDRDVVSDVDPETLTLAEGVYGDWIEGTVRRGFGSDAAQLRALTGDRLYDGYFLAWCATEELGEFYYALDPGEAEQVQLGQFVPLELDDREAHRVDKAIRKGQREGRYSRLRADDLGDWDTWISSALRDSSGAPLPGGAGFEPEHYTLDVRVDPAEGEIDGVASVRVRAEWGGSRSLSFSTDEEIEFSDVKDAQGNALPWIRTEDGLLVILPEALEAGTTTELAIGFSGKVLSEIQKGIFVLRDTYSWYPRIGDLGRATYEATLRWPKRHELLASGRVVDSGQEGDLRWERRELDIPTIAFSFEVGAFDLRTIEAGDVTITVAFSKVTGALAKGAKQDLLDHLARSLVFFEKTFGDYPLDYMTVVTLPRSYSQGFLGFVTLSHALISDRISRYLDTSIADTVAHEVSHQWWGNKVGWNGYRDQWLSEALADFSAMLYAADEADRKSVYLAQQARRWKSALGRRVLDGRTIESLGPVVMGNRLQSSKSSSAYAAIVYQKGSVVFNMLAQSLQPGPFSQMLKSLADAVNHRVIDTETFLSSIERMSGADLEEFSRRFVYGTGIPEVYYNYRFDEQDDGSWLIDGQARQTSPGRFDYTLVKREDGWDLTRSHTPFMDVAGASLAVPFQVSLAESEESQSDGATTARGLGGRLVLSGEQSEFSIPIPERPDHFWFDQRGEVLVRFISERRQPKRMLRYRASQLAVDENFDEAESLYQKALEAPYYSEAVEDPPSKKNLERLTNRQNGLIHIDLARMYLDMGRDADALNQMDLTDALLKGREKNFYETTRVVLRSHLAIRAADYKGAYQKLEKIAFLKFPFRYGDTIANSSRRRKFSSRGRRRLDGRGYALFAVAAYEMGQPEIARQAAKAAAERGAVILLLEELLDTSETAAGSDCDLSDCWHVSVPSARPVALSRSVLAGVYFASVHRLHPILNGRTPRREALDR